tara:strand:+ start:1954 stop:3108 length:1155 start_codon:yes stop_codon:yes gene_type:complete
MIIEIKGVQFVNKGAELMLYAVLQRIRLYWPEAKIALAPNVNSSYENRAKLGALQKISLSKYPFDFNFIAYILPKRIRDYLKSWGIVTEADIDVVLDASGFAYGDQWNPVLLKNALKEAKRAAKHKRKYIFLPQAFGPFTNPKHAKLIQEMMHYPSLVCAREQQSFQHISALSPNGDNVKVYPDFTNALIAQTPDNIDAYQQGACLIPNYNMLSAKNPNKGWIKSYIDLFVYAAEQCLKAGVKPYLLNHEGAQDLAICQQINQCLSQPLEIVVEPHPEKVKGYIKHAQLIVCSRFHGCVSALSQAIPCIGTSWSHKYEELFSEYGAGNFLVHDQWQHEEVETLIAAALNRTPELMANLTLKSEHYKALTEQMWTEVVKTVNGVK